MDIDRPNVCSDSPEHLWRLLARDAGNPGHALIKSPSDLPDHLADHLTPVQCTGFLKEDFSLCALGSRHSYPDFLDFLSFPCVLAVFVTGLAEAASRADPYIPQRATPSLWVRDYKPYSAPRPSRDNAPGIIYFGAAHWRVGGKRVVALVQFVPHGSCSRPHYHRNQELYVCLQGGFKMAGSRRDGSGGIWTRDIEAATLMTVEPETLHPIRSTAEAGTWNIVCCVRAKAWGDGVLRNHYWKDVPEEVYSSIVEALGDA